MAHFLKNITRPHLSENGKHMVRGDIDVDTARLLFPSGREF